jgi:glutaminyl-peptide cyclotransferase
LPHDIRVPGATFCETPMLRSVLALALLLQTPDVARFDSNRAWDHLRQLVAMGPRPSGSPALEQSRTYIKDQLAAIGLTAIEQKWMADTPAGRLAMTNLMATVPGARKDRLVIAGHYDTKRFSEFRFLGANDGGSSAAFLIEMARVIKARNNPLTIELLFLDGEEAVRPVWQGTDNTYGSRHYVDMARRDGSLASLKALLLVDMIGDRDLRIKRDSNSTIWLSDVIWEEARRLKLDGYFVPCPPDNVRVPCSTTVEDDHLPFLKAGVPAVDIIDLEYEHWHKPGDTLDAVSARSLQVVGDVMLAALPRIEGRLTNSRR